MEGQGRRDGGGVVVDGEVRDSVMEEREGSCYFGTDLLYWYLQS